jgi:hypothetical protein
MALPSAAVISVDGRDRSAGMILKQGMAQTPGGGGRIGSARRVGCERSNRAACELMIHLIALATEPHMSESLQRQ